MRIVGGEFRGRNLAAPKTNSIRPTIDRTRESLFNILSHAYPESLDGTRVLDVFAGTGAVGLEALSRGCRVALFVENGVEGRGLLWENIDALGLHGRARILRRDATKLAWRRQQYRALRSPVRRSALWPGPRGEGICCCPCRRLAGTRCARHSGRARRCCGQCRAGVQTARKPHLRRLENALLPLRALEHFQQKRPRFPCGNAAKQRVRVFSRFEEKRKRSDGSTFPSRHGLVLFAE